jgi:uncharacterized membrane protein
MTPRRQRPRTADHAYADVLDAVGDVPLTGAVAGVLFGPAGLAVGIVGGGIAGGMTEARVPELHDALFDEVRADVTQGSSAIVLLAGPDHVDAMAAAFEHRGGQLVRRHLSPEAARALEAAVAGRPLAAG